MGCSLNSLNGAIEGSIGVIKGDARSLELQIASFVVWVERIRSTLYGVHFVHGSLSLH